MKTKIIIFEYLEALQSGLVSRVVSEQELKSEVRNENCILFNHIFVMIMIIVVEIKFLLFYINTCHVD